MGVPQQYGHAAADAEGGGGEEDHTAGRDPQLEAADRAAAAAHAAEVAKYAAHIGIGAARVLLIEVRPHAMGLISVGIASAAPLLSAAIGVGFTVAAFGTTDREPSATWTMQRIGGELSPDFKHQLRKAIGETMSREHHGQHLGFKVTCC